MEQDERKHTFTLTRVVDLSEPTTDEQLAEKDPDAPSISEQLAELGRDEFKELADSVLQNSTLQSALQKTFANAMSPALHEAMVSVAKHQAEAMTPVWEAMMEALSGPMESLASKFREQFAEHEDVLDHNFQYLVDAGYTEEQLESVAWMLVADVGWVAYLLQDKVGHCPVGDALVVQLRGGIPKDESLRGNPVRGQSIANAAIMSGLTEKMVRTIMDGRPITVDEASRLAIGYNVTPAEFLGFMDADEVRLLTLWRGMDADKQQALFTLLES